MYYKSLFNINIHHGYFLDKGNEKYLPIVEEDDEMSDEDKNTALREYDFSEYLTIKPTIATQRIFKNYKVVFRKHSQGFRILVNTNENQPIIPFGDDITFTFALQSTDPYFQNYTNMSGISENEMHLFTNVVPEDQDEFENIFENNGGAIQDQFLLDDVATRNLIKEIAAEDESFLSINQQFSLTHSIQLIQDEEIVAEDEIEEQEKEEEKEARIIELLNQDIQRKKQQRIVGYIRLKIKGDDDKHLFEFGEEDIIPEFTLSFVNRKTKWRFFSASDNKTFVTKEEKWLSRNGFTEIIGQPPDEETPTDLIPEPDKEYEFPNPTVESITTVENIINEDNIVYTDYSEIFI